MVEENHELIIVTNIHSMNVETVYYIAYSDEILKTLGYRLKISNLKNSSITKINLTQFKSSIKKF